MSNILLPGRHKIDRVHTDIIWILLETIRNLEPKKNHDRKAKGINFDLY